LCVFCIVCFYTLPALSQTVDDPKLILGRGRGGGGGQFGRERE
jgi:hypothetical protein